MSFLTQLPALKLAGLSVHLGRFDASQFSEAQAKWLHCPEYDVLKKAVLKRQAEFVAGRMLAQQALRECGAPFEQPIAIGKHRQPLWPQGVAGSISHSLKFAACAVTTKPQALLGLDIEETLSFAVARSIQAMVGTPTEWALLLEKMALDQAVTLLFSAKESVFKALFPTINRYLEFSDARLESIEHNCLILKLQHAPISNCYRVLFTWREASVLTMVFEDRSENA
ncbi:4'-phosphopantetheinyl transferase family protein [Vibrio cidicii]|uniref:4'-phosphopantetheinyl transferase family protein n=1 Tax=Vibrio cidicii TaxID=1763883 RepID=UPI0018C25C13|nr:4'-phosphopantetheinyl transferase superfamily protein [Vibrio cidicii]MBG0757055.1 hypothetical protein [Vibrio cidicii]